jgi:hypothetical protein
MNPTDAYLPRPTPEAAPLAEAMLVAQWQDGLQMLSGYRQQKLRLSFQRLTLEQSNRL